MKLQKTIVLLLAGTALTTATAMAQQVGTATAVNPETRTTPPGGATVVLKVGAHVMHKERIKTTPTGSVQLLFLDRSTLSIAPNSDIVIDEFVYNPANGRGHMAVSVAKGAAIGRRSVEPRRQSDGQCRQCHHWYSRRYRHFYHQRGD
jgi:hypothetical protein